MNDSLIAQATLDSVEIADGGEKDFLFAVDLHGSARSAQIGDDVCTV
jgi:hypothetical protein